MYKTSRRKSLGRYSPKHLIVDQGPDFDCEHFKGVWCNAKGILLRFGGVGKHGSIAVIGRFHLTFKEIVRLMAVPEDQAEFEREANLIVQWYNEHRPHMNLNGETPNEVYYSREPTNEQRRIEPRRDWPRGSPCAKPQVDVDGAAGNLVIIEFDCHEGRRHLPIVRARRAA